MENDMTEFRYTERGSFRDLFDLSGDETRHRRKDREPTEVDLRRLEGVFQVPQPQVRL